MKRISCQEVPSILTKFFTISVTSVTKLDGYDDQNFKIVTDKGVQHVLKVHNKEDSESPGILEETNRLLLFCSQNGLNVPVPVQLEDGSVASVKINLDDVDHVARLLTFLPGTLINDVELTPELLMDVGENLGVFSRVTSSFQSRILEERITIWSLLNINQVRNFLPCIDSQKQRKMIEDVFDSFQNVVINDGMSGLPRQLVHSDWNEANILVTSDSQGCWKFSAILDFGDVHFAPRIFDLASLILYMILSESSLDMDQVAKNIIKGYSRKVDMTSREKQVIPFCVSARLAQSLTLGAYSCKEHPENADYTSKTAQNGWIVLEELLCKMETLEQKWIS